MPTVDFIYDLDCPNVALARENLLRAFARAGVTPSWCEHSIVDASRPPHTHGYGSPTILIDGRDVAGAAPGAEIACRVYAGSNGLARVPDVDTIANALRVAGPTFAPALLTTKRRTWLSSLSVIPGIGVALLPKVACPACWPAYAGVLSALGLGFLLDTTWLLALTIGFLTLALGGLAFRARRRRGYGPLAFGSLAAVIVVIGKFVFTSNTGMYAGLALLVAASLWNSWPRRASTTACSSCVPQPGESSCPCEP